MSVEKSKYKIHIVGSGVSGLIAALVLEKNGYSPMLLEATDRVGGRVKTDVLGNIPLDHGFQVLLTAYPMVKKYLDLDALELSYFEPGAAIIHDGKETRIGDPLRNLSFLYPTLISKIATFQDKIKIFRLQQRLKQKSIEAIFETSEESTLTYLKNLGFSDSIIKHFFKPFFSGIFLENELNTSSRMFEFVYKMFGEGSAAIPKKGIEAIPSQLKSKLKHTEFVFNTEVKEVKDDGILLKNGDWLQSDFTIIATEANALVANLRNQELPWKGCDTLYFEVPKLESKGKLIRLIKDDKGIINTIVSLSNLFESVGDKETLSITIVKRHHLSIEELIDKVSEELLQHLGITEAKFLKHYHIEKALPNITNVKDTLAPEETRLTTRIFLAGDTLLNGSLNGAMKAGEQAAKGVVKLLEDSPDLAQFTSEYL